MEPSAASCLEIAKRAGLKDWAIGKSKIFLKYFHIERLNQKMELYHHAATLIQKGLLVKSNVPKRQNLRL